MAPDEWTWKFYERAKNQYDRLDPHEQDRVTSKLDDIVSDEWRDPDDYLEPLTGAAHSKLRIGHLRLGTEVDYETRTLNIYTIEQRGGAYTPGDE